MAVGVMTVKGREKICKAHAGDLTLPQITYMAFGSGGVNEGGSVIETTGNETELGKELLRKTISSHSFIQPATMRYTVRIEKAELANQSISEMGLFDSEGDLVAYKTFLPKGKDGDMEFEFNMDEIF